MLKLFQKKAGPKWKNVGRHDRKATPKNGTPGEGVSKNMELLLCLLYQFLILETIGLISIGTVPVRAKDLRVRQTHLRSLRGDRIPLEGLKRPTIRRQFLSSGPDLLLGTIYPSQFSQDRLV
jgi:hypothetical protein